MRLGTVIAFLEGFEYTMFNRKNIFVSLALSLLLVLPVVAGFVGHGTGDGGGSSGAHLANLDSDANKSGWLSASERTSALGLGYSDNQSDADMWAAAKGRSINSHPSDRSSTQLTTGSGTTNIGADQYTIDCDANHAAACDTLTRSEFSVVKSATDIALDLGFSSDQSYGAHTGGGHSTSTFPASDWEGCYTSALTGTNACPMDKDGYTAFTDIRSSSNVCSLADSKLTDFYNGNGVTNAAFATSDMSSLTSAETDYLCDCVGDLSDKSLANIKNCGANASGNNLSLFIVQGVKEGTYAASNITSSLLSSLGVYGTTDTQINQDMFEGNYCKTSDGTDVNCLTHMGSFISGYSNNSIYSSASSFKNKICSEMSARVYKKVNEWQYKKHYYVEACQEMNLFAESDVAILNWPTAYKTSTSATPHHSSYAPSGTYTAFTGEMGSYSGSFANGVGNLNAFDLHNGQFKFAIWGNVTKRREHKAKIGVTFKNTACIKHKGGNHPYFVKSFPVSILKNESDFDVNPLALGTLAASASTMTINLAASAATSSTAGTYTAVTNTETDFEKADFLASDISGVKIIAASSITGSLQYDGTAVTNGQVIRAHKLDELTYTPASGATASSNYASFTYKTYTPFPNKEFAKRGFACNACAGYTQYSASKPDYCWVNSAWYGGVLAGGHSYGDCLCTDAQRAVTQSVYNVRRNVPGCTGWDNQTGYASVYKYLDASKQAPATPEALVRDAQCN